MSTIIKISTKPATKALNIKYYNTLVSNFANVIKRKNSSQPEFIAATG